MYASSNTFSDILPLPHPALDMWQEQMKRFDANDSCLMAFIAGVVVGPAVCIFCNRWF